MTPRSYLEQETARSRDHPGQFPSTHARAPSPILAERSGAPSRLQPSSNAIPMPCRLLANLPRLDASPSRALPQAAGRG